MNIEEKNGIQYITFAQFKKYPELVAAVSTRAGGVSDGAFSSLNMSFSTGDMPERVIENRRRYFAVLRLDPKDSVGCNQVHGVNIVRVGKRDCGKGASSRESAISACDGLVTNEKGVALTMNFADCTPLLFFDPVRHAIGLAHGGWRGTAGNIAGRTVGEMHTAFGSEPADIIAAVGPAIGPDRFEVGAEVIAAFTELFGSAEVKELYRPIGEGKYLYDLWETNRRLMLCAGLKEEHIECTRICTHTHADIFFSYRREKGKTGRHMAVMALR